MYGMWNSICMLPWIHKCLDGFGRGTGPGPCMTQMSCLSYRHVFSEHLLAARHGGWTKLCSSQHLFLGGCQFIVKDRHLWEVCGVWFHTHQLSIQMDQRWVLSPPCPCSVANVSSSLGFGFLICKMGIRIIPPSSCYESLVRLCILITYYCVTNHPQNFMA